MTFKAGSYRKSTHCVTELHKDVNMTMQTQWSTLQRNMLLCKNNEEHLRNPRLFLVI